jgi:hypothetical protein
MAPRIGRPPLFRHRVKLDVFLEHRELVKIKRAAKEANRSASAWVRAAALTLLTRPGRRETDGTD